MLNWVRVCLVAITLVVIGASPAAAQGAPLKPEQIEVTGYAGACVATVTLAVPNKEKDLEIVLRVNGKGVADDTLKKAATTLEMKAGLQLAKGDDLQAVVSDGGAPVVSKEFPVVDAPKGTKVSTAGCPKEVEPRNYDDRDVVEIIAYGGLAIDTFAPAKLGNYVERKDDGTEVAIPTQTMTRQRAIAGIDFAYRLTKKSRPVQFWISGETMYGSRTADFCKEEEKCFEEATDLTKNFTKVLRSASSFEAYITPRLEFWTFQKDSEAPLALYATGRLGLIALDGAPGISGSHHVGIGTIITKGRFEGTLVEAGWGKTELFADPEKGKPKWNRLKIDALAAIRMTDDTYAFVQLYIDTTLRRNDTSSGLQTFIGIEKNLNSWKLW